MSHRAPTLLVAAVTIGLAWSLPATAVAANDPEPASIHDGRGDGRGIDIKRTTIQAATQSRIEVDTLLYSFGKDKLNASEVWLDTNNKNAGPEFRVLSFRAHDGDPLKGTKLLKVTNFRDGGKEKDCAGLKVSYLVKDNLIKTLVPRSCVGRPDKVRYNAITWDFRKYVGGSPVSGFSDYSPKKGRLSAPWG